MWNLGDGGLATAYISGTSPRNSDSNSAHPPTLPAPRRNRRKIAAFPVAAFAPTRNERDSHTDSSGVHGLTKTPAAFLSVSESRRVAGVGAKRSPQTEALNGTRLQSPSSSPLVCGKSPRFVTLQPNEIRVRVLSRKAAQFNSRGRQPAEQPPIKRNSPAGAE